MAAESELPPLPDHPEPDECWTWGESTAIRQYATAARAPLLEHIGELEAKIARLKEQLEAAFQIANSRTQDRDTLRAELERCRADAERWRFFLARRFVMAGNLVVMDAHRTAMRDELISAIDAARAAQAEDSAPRAEGDEG